MMIQERCWADLRDYRPITLLLLRCNYFYDDWTIDCTDSIRFRSRNMDNHPYEKIDTSPCSTFQMDTIDESWGYEAFAISLNFGVTKLSCLKNLCRFH